MVPSKADHYYWIEKYAVAQSVMDVDLVIHHKNMICGKKPLTEVPVKTLEKLINKLRKVHSGDDNRHRPREERWSSYNKYKENKYAQVPKRADWDG